MRTKPSSKKRSAREEKCLAAACELADRGILSSYDGLAYCLRGDSEAGEYADLQAFGTLTSLSKKKIRAIVRSLLRQGLFAEVSPPPHVQIYLELTIYGEEEARRILEKGIRKTVKKPAIPLFIERNHL